MRQNQLAGLLHRMLAGVSRPPPEDAPRSTGYDDQQASAEGWAVFDCGPAEDGCPRMQIQRIDVPEHGDPVFPDDPAAWRHVVERARQGSLLHQRALAMADPVERFLIEAECGAWTNRP